MTHKGWCYIHELDSNANFVEIILRMRKPSGFFQSECYQGPKNGKQQIYIWTTTQTTLTTQNQERGKDKKN